MNNARKMSMDTDPQQQKAAWPRMLGVRSFLRNVAGGHK
jgi:hypothetical protein